MTTPQQRSTPARRLDLLNSFKELTDQDILPKNSKWGDWDTELKLFETGQLAIVSSSGSSLSRIKDEAPDVYNNIGVAAPLTGSEGFSRNALMNLVVPEASKHHEEAIKFCCLHHRRRMPAGILQADGHLPVHHQGRPGSLLHL